MKITYFGKKMLFPIREGLDRLTWDIARVMEQRGFDVEIRCISDKKSIRRVHGISIIEDNIFALSRFKTDILHLLVHPNPEIILPLLFGRMKKSIITVCDGGLGNFWGRLWSPLVIWLVRKKVDSILVQTEYQQAKLAKLHISSKIILPYLADVRRKRRRDSSPSLLYMGLPSEQKGFTDVVDAFRIAKKSIRSLRLTIADSHVMKNSEKCYESLLHDRDIRIKHIIDREIELSRAWIYLYPVRSPRNTMALPLSLIESAKIGTAFITTRMGGIPEIAPTSFLVPPAAPDKLAAKIVELVRSYPKKIALKIKFNNHEIMEQLLAEYILPG